MGHPQLNSTCGQALHSGNEPLHKPRSKRSWRRSKICIPDRTSSLSQTPRRSRRARKLDRPDSISIHDRKCRMFSSIDEILALTRDSPPPRYSSLTTRPSYVSVEHPSSEKEPSQAIDISSTSALLSSIPTDSQVQQSRAYYNTVMTWTSDETRQREYKKIDKAYSGWRGYLNQILPRSLRHARRDFFRGECDGDSVRRMRVSLPKEPEDQAKERRRWSCF